MLKPLSAFAVEHVCIALLAMLHASEHCPTAPTGLETEYGHTVEAVRRFVPLRLSADDSFSGSKAAKLPTRWATRSLQFRADDQLEYPRPQNQGVSCYAIKLLIWWLIRYTQIMGILMPSPRASTPLGGTVASMYDDLSDGDYGWTVSLSRDGLRILRRRHPKRATLFGQCGHNHRRL